MPHYPTPKLLNIVTKKFKIYNFLVLMLTIFSSSASYSAVAPLTVNGYQIQVDGEARGLAGNSLFWSNTGWGAERFYNDNVISWLKTDWQANIVRAAMGVEDSGGYLSDPTGNMDRVKAVVDAAIAEDLYVIIDWHSHHAEDYQAEAIEFFTEMAQTYGSHNNVIYEIYNEPLQISWSSTIKPYAEAVIAAIRAVDPDNLIVVGTPTWSQDVDQAAADPITGYDNIAYTLHFYAGTHGQWLRDRAELAMNAGIALMVTEWGTVNATGDGAVAVDETNAWVDWMKQYNLTHLNWSVHDKVEGASILQPGASSSGGWSSSDLTESGTFVRELIQAYNEGSNNGGGGISSPCDNAPSINLPGLVEAENYCEQNGIQTQATSDTGGGDNVGWIQNGDWTEYSINVTQAGTYELDARIATPTIGGTIEILVDNVNVGSIDVATTGGWQTWQTESTTVQLAAGQHVLRLNYVGGSNYLMNINRLEFSQNSGGGNGNTNDTEGVICEFLIENQWSDGFVGEIQVSNNSDTAITGNWSVEFQFTDGSTISSGWNGTLAGTNPYTIAPLSWNSTIAQGDTIVFGVQVIKGTSGSAAPTPIVTGSICD